MTNWYEKKYINKQAWLIENCAKLKLDAKQFQIILLICYFNDNHEYCNSDQLVKYSGMDSEEVDQILAQLSKMNYLKILVKNDEVIFNIDGIFKEEVITPTSLPILENFEKEFGRTFSNSEISKLIDLSNQYSEEELYDGLREASMYRKLSLSYIEKIVSNKYGNKK